MTQPIPVVVGGGDVATVTFANNKPFALISGTCAIESRDTTFKTAEALVEATQKLGIPFIYKGSFDKANRTSGGGKRGVGLEEGLKILQEVRKTFKVPVITDIHNEEQAQIAGEVVDILQIPAFLCRQTDLLIAAARTGKTINVKKGQFLAPHDMHNVVKKIAEEGNTKVLQCERGATFGYNNLVSDFRGLRIMAENGYPVVFDATHSTQMPGGQGTSSGGNRAFMEPLARAALSVGVAGIFAESHPCPAEAISDAAIQIPLDKMAGLLKTLKAFDELAKNHNYQDIK